MASKRRSQGSVRMNFRPPGGDSSQRCDGAAPRGTKPTAELTSIMETFTIISLYVCKKSIFFNTDIKVGLYLAALFFISIVCDFAPLPRSYMSRSDNIFNKYFVKLAWGWNLTLLVPFCLLSSYVYCCGNREKIVRNHLPRIVIATGAWYVWTHLFNVVEALFGRCNARTFATKELCLKNGYMWNGLDISGHSFILIYGSLVLIEECRSIVNWESIRNFLRDEEHRRTTKDTTNNNPLKNLSDEELVCLRRSYDKFTPYIRGLFITITCLQILWDVMLVCTLLYYHIMIEKFIGGAVAILTWFVTYRVWYKTSTVPPALPGEGCFRYIKDKSSPPFPASRRRVGSAQNGPTFMGMPIYGLKTDSNAGGGNMTPPARDATSAPEDPLPNSSR